MIVSKKDYCESGMTIRSAMLDDAKNQPRRSIADNYIIWGGKEIRTSSILHPPWSEGSVKLSFLKREGSDPQGLDLKVDDGELTSTEGLVFKTLRTWASDEYEDEVEYRYRAPSRAIWAWNVYNMIYPSGRSVEEKWTENAGMWVEQKSADTYLLHCSSGVLKSPNFENFVVQVEFRPVRKD